MEKKIDFFIIGAQKAATTGLFNYLRQHPDIYLPALKENHYFSLDEFYCQGTRYLEAFYRDAHPEQLWGGADVNLMYFPVGAERLANYNRHIKVIAVLRNPVDRAYSAYWFARRNSTETCESFDEALTREEGRARGSLREQVELTYLRHGHYYEQLKRFIDLLGHEQVHVVLTSDLREEPAQTVSLTLSWLGASSDTESIDFSRRFNKAGVPRFPTLHRLIHSNDIGFKRIFRHLTPPRFRYLVRTRILNPILARNIEARGYPEMSADTRAKLVEYFRPHNRKLEKLIDRDLSHWR